MRFASTVWYFSNPSPAPPTARPPTPSSARPSVCTFEPLGFVWCLVCWGHRTPSFVMQVGLGTAGWFGPRPGSENFKTHGRSARKLRGSIPEARTPKNVPEAPTPHFEQWTVRKNDSQKHENQFDHLSFLFARSEHQSLHQTGRSNEKQAS